MAEDLLSLPEEDYLGILDLIKKFQSCENRGDLRECLQGQLLPFFEAQATVAAWTDPDLQNFNVMDCVGFAEEEYPVIQKFLPYDTNVKAILGLSRSTMATDIDVPRKNIKRDFAKFFNENPQFKSISEKSFDRLETIMISMDSPDNASAIGIHRHAPVTKPWTMRDVRVLELLRPTLLHTLKFIYLNEELSRYKSFTKSLTDSSSAMALVSLDLRVIFRNPSFYDLLKLELGTPLPAELIEIIKKENMNFDSAMMHESSVLELPFYHIPQGAFRVSCSLLNSENTINEQCWLVKLKPVVEPYSKLNLFMQKAKLSPREMEIACLVRDGISNQEIAQRLFISLHTVNTHLRNMHEKLDVSSRIKLVAVLNQVWDDNQ